MWTPGFKRQGALPCELIYTNHPYKGSQLLMAGAYTVAGNTQ